MTRLISGMLLALTLVSCDSMTPEPPTSTPSSTTTPTHAQVSEGSPTPANDTPTISPGVITLAPATATPISPPTPTPPLSGPVFGLAWFHKPPTEAISYGDTTVDGMAAEHRYVHLTGPSDVPFRKQLRGAGYDGPIYTYIMSAGKRLTTTCSYSRTRRYSSS
ncbi:MAG: hypothetical protein ABIO92_05265 [Chloroflexia bacterium]